ncbi:MAG: hypothetical protein IPO99_20545 [Nitrospira sp.]|nr:hypothetical protein [Nitrospira sp.]
MSGRSVALGIQQTLALVRRDDGNSVPRGQDELSTRIAKVSLVALAT